MQQGVTRCHSNTKTDIMRITKSTDKIMPLRSHNSQNKQFKKLKQLHDVYLQFTQEWASNYEILILAYAQ